MEDKTVDVMEIIEKISVPDDFLKEYHLNDEIKKELYFLYGYRNGIFEHNFENNICESIITGVAVSDLKIEMIYGNIRENDFYELKEEYCY